jgi:hypothetical protein
VTSRVRHSAQDSGTQASGGRLQNRAACELTRRELIFGSAAVAVSMALQVSVSSQQETQESSSGATSLASIEVAGRARPQTRTGWFLERSVRCC